MTLPTGTPNQLAGQDRSAALPTVGVVIATHNRPGPLREALASVLEQDYAGAVEVVVVCDQSEPDLTLESAMPRRRVRVVSN
ncbi:MAG TPA: glycosyltransferase, partial [Intrasporangium sp.]|uniref:glycosyltransferase n=1 Tax=Intrasporangium sp. TaxID=1925024 RepID=UPI002D77C776